MVIFQTTFADVRGFLVYIYRTLNDVASTIVVIMARKLVAFSTLLALIPFATAQTASPWAQCMHLSFSPLLLSIQFTTYPQAADRAGLVPR